MVSEFSERNESGQKTFSGREFVKPRLHYGDPIVPPGHCDAPPLPVIAIRPPCHCGAPPPVIAARHPRHCDTPSLSLRAAKLRSKPAASIVIATHHPPSLRAAKLRSNPR